MEMSRVVRSCQGHDLTLPNRERVHKYASNRCFMFRLSSVFWFQDLVGFWDRKQQALKRSERWDTSHVLCGRCEPNDEPNDEAFFFSMVRNDLLVIWCNYNVNESPSFTWIMQMYMVVCVYNFQANHCRCSGKKHLHNPLYFIFLKRSNLCIKNYSKL
jgi:hypothetical protein